MAKMIKTTTPVTLKQWLDSGEAVLIDVREQDEYAAEHIDGALLCPLSHFLDSFHMNDYDTTKKIVFQCRSGKRSDQACRIVNETGPHKADIYNLEGGILAWKACGLPIVS